LRRKDKECRMTGPRQTQWDAFPAQAYRDVLGILLRDGEFLEMLHRYACELQQQGAVQDAMLLFGHVAGNPDCPGSVRAWARYKQGELFRLAGDRAATDRALDDALDGIPGHVKARLLRFPPGEPLVVVYGQPGPWAPAGIRLDFPCHDLWLWQYYLGNRPADELWIFPALKLLAFEPAVLREVLTRYVADRGTVVFSCSKDQRLSMDKNALLSMVAETGSDFRRLFQERLIRELVV
jgi:hypothetical protein